MLLPSSSGDLARNAIMVGIDMAEGLEGRWLLTAYLVTDSMVSHLSDSATLNRIIQYAANDGVHGNELWESKGTSKGTSIVADLAPGETSSNPQKFDIVNGRVTCFTYDDKGLKGIPSLVTGQVALWTTDGTAAATVAIARLGVFREGPVVASVITRSLRCIE
jgi:ELWxxDGT repeat protein